MRRRGQYSEKTKLILKSLMDHQDLDTREIAEKYGWNERTVAVVAYRYLARIMDGESPVSERKKKMRETLQQVVRGAVARGWCTPQNSSKEMDSDLAESIAAHVILSLPDIKRSELAEWQDQGDSDLAKLPNTMDAMVWANGFMAQMAETPGIATDRDAMLSWFANAIMAGYDEARRRYETD